MGLCESKAQRFLDEVKRHGKTTDFTALWMFNRLRRLVLPGNYIACETCGMPTTYEGITIDHKIPHTFHANYAGNVHNVINIQLVCCSCNSMKGQKTLKEFLEQLYGINQSILELRTKQPNGANEFIAPLFPAIGIGLQRFGEDQSGKLYSPPGNHRKPKATSPRLPSIHLRSEPNNANVPLPVTSTPSGNRTKPRHPISKRRRHSPKHKASVTPNPQPA